MFNTIKRMMLGIGLIVAAVTVLLVSDLSHREQSTNGIPRVALLNYATRPLLEQGEQGVIEELKAQGFVPGDQFELQIFNAENDLPTANMMASAIVGGGFDMVISLSTPCLQAMASANHNGSLTHIFGLVTDPFGAGVGISRSDPMDHPAYMAGIGTFQPVVETFEIAREMNPTLKRVGVVWNPSEACSEACVIMARGICEKLGIELLEATVDLSSGVLEAARSLVARNAEALWVGGDNTVGLALESMVKAGSEGKIPVFTNNPKSIDRGALFGLGADYLEVGKVTGGLACKVLQGLDPASIRIENVVPKKLSINEQVLTGLKDRWILTDRINTQVAKDVTSKR